MKSISQLQRQSNIKRMIIHIRVVLLLSIEASYPLSNIPKQHRKNYHHKTRQPRAYYTTFSLFDENGEQRIERDFEG